MDTDRVSEPQDSDVGETSGTGWGVRIGAALLLAAVMVLGIVVLGRVATTTTMAMVITTAFFLVVGLVVFLLARSRRALRVPLAVTYVVVAGVAGIYLGLPLITDDVVDEEVIQAEAAQPAQGTEPLDPEQAPDPAATSGPVEPEPTGPIAIAAGTFVSQVHPGEGTATLIDTGEGSTVVTLTEFATDNGPDLRVYLVPDTAPAGTVDGFVDLGALKGNIGDQQYEIPSEVDAGAGWRVVVWCRAFSVNFTDAVLT